MRPIKLLLLTLMLLSANACADNQTKERKKEGKENMTQSILTEKPSFNLRIEGLNTQFIIYLNGVSVFKHYSLHPAILDYPINNFIATGKNKLEVFVFGGGANNDIINNNAKCKVTLFVRKFNDFETPEQDILTLSYDHSKKNRLEGTTLAGEYDSKDGFKKSHGGDVTVEEATISSFEPVELLPSKGAIAHMEFSLPTPFPRWKFLDAPADILEVPYYGMTMEQAKYFQKNHPKLNKLYELNHQIYNAAKNKDIDTVVSFFKERNEEADIAFYYKKGDTQKKLEESLYKSMNDSSQKLLKIKDEDWNTHISGYFVEKSNNMANLRSTLCWNSIDYPGSSCFKMRFRYDGHKWVLTR